MRQLSLFHWRNGEPKTRTQLKGITCVTAKLADGRRVTYWYAWRGGPRLPGKLGSPEFVASYNAAVANRAKPLSKDKTITTFAQPPKRSTSSDRSRHERARTF
jgi:hypothetical protein